MSATVITLLAQTHIHPGIGQSNGALDLPVARERTTHFPFIPGSGVKGAYRVWAQEQAKSLDVDTLFGKGGGDAGNDEGAGGLLFSDARLLLLPVRALHKAWRWVTSPDLLRRYRHDLARCRGQAEPEISLPSVEDGRYLGAGEQWLGLEEREFEHAGEIEAGLIKEMATASGETEVFVKERLVILSDDDFVWFARYALPVMARNNLDENKRSKNLWYEESLPPDTLMHVLIGERKAKMLEPLLDNLVNVPYIQMGGNETIGQGWFRMQRPGGGNG